MRPVRLALRGFGAFRDDTEVDFTDADFFALVGPTGSGKSTVIDAICFALFGSVPRLDDSRLVAPVMSTGAAETRVLLEFEVGGVRHRAARVLRRDAKGKVGTKEARLERSDGTVLAGRESEMRTAVPELLGLDFEDFTRCVVLPQGEFARFLHQEPRERQNLLVRLLELGVYGKLATRAAQRAAAAETELRVATARLADLAPHDDATVAATVAALDAARALEATVAAAVGELAGLDAAVAALAAQMAGHEARLAALERVRPPDGLAARAEQAAVALAAEQAATAEAERAGRAVEAAEAAVAGWLPVAEYDRILGVRERIERGRTVVEERAAEVQATAAVAAQAAAALAEAEATATAAEQELRRLDDAHRAHAVALTLRPGEPCPVCEQTVTTLPVPVAPPGREAAEAAREAAAAALRRARQVEASAREAARAAEVQHQNAVSLLAQLEAEVAGAPSADEATAARREAAAAEAALVAARQHERQARAAQRAATEQRAAAERAGADDLEQYHRQRDPLAADGAPAPSPDLAASWMELAAWAAGRAEAVRAELAVAGDEHGRQATARDSLAQATRDTLRAAGAATRGTAPAELTAAAADHRTRAELALRAVEESRAQAVVLEADVTRHDAERAVAAELAKLLKADRFQRWLVEATLDTLARRASQTLRRLSSGQFSLRHEGDDFVVVDHSAADETRPVRTLSGGETFQASLALALALSDQLVKLSGRGARRLDSIFLDEGFGTLDPDTLETVASTIEQLGGQGRMVGIVTHVKELADRVPVRFQVRRGPRGATVERVAV